MRNLSLGKKKGQVGLLAPAILALVFAGVVLVFGIVMAQELRDTQAGTQLMTVATNKTLSITETSISSEITESNYCGYTSWTPTVVYNGTNTTILTLTTDYTVNANGSLMNVTHVIAPLSVTYTYYYGGEACEAANSTVVGLGTFADFWEIIVLAIVITVVIGLLLVIFGGRQRR